MDLNKFKASFLSYDDIRGSAKNFLKRYNPTNEIPVNIELIVERDFEINIIPVELERLLGIDALTSVNQKEIRVDINTLKIITTDIGFHWHMR